MTQDTIDRIAMAQSALELGCAPEDFQRAEHRVFTATTHPQARKYLQLPFLCQLVSYGKNIVACGRADLVPLIQDYLACIPDFVHCFETPGMYALNERLAPYDAKVCFMAEYFLPDLNVLEHIHPTCPYPTKRLTPSDFADLYVPAWSNALCKDRKHLDVLAVGAYDGDTLVGLAGCSCDAEDMWQIGIDVLPAYRRQGIACALTHQLACEILRHEKVPFYCAAWSNIRSVRNAISAGFRPAWVEMTAKENTFIENMLKKQEGSDELH